MASLWLALERDLAASTTVLALRQRRWFGCRSGWCRDWLRRLNGHARGRLHSRCWLASAAFAPTCAQCAPEAETDERHLHTRACSSFGLRPRGHSSAQAGKPFSRQVNRRNALIMGNQFWAEGYGEVPFDHGDAFVDRLQWTRLQSLGKSILLIKTIILDLNLVTRQVYL